MGDPGNQLAQSRHFFRLQQLGLDQPLPRNVAINLKPACACTARVQQRPRKALDHFSRRTRQFDFLPPRLIRAADVLAPPCRSFGRIAEAAGQAFDQCLDRPQLHHGARFHSHDLRKAVADHADASPGVQQQYARIDRVHNARQRHIELGLLRYRHGLPKSPLKMRLQDQIAQQQRRSHRCQSIDGSVDQPVVHEVSSMKHCSSPRSLHCTAIAKLKNKLSVL